MFACSFSVSLSSSLPLLPPSFSLPLSRARSLSLSPFTHLFLLSFSLSVTLSLVLANVTHTRHAPHTHVRCGREDMVAAITRELEVMTHELANKDRQLANKDVEIAEVCVRMCMCVCARACAHFFSKQLDRSVIFTSIHKPNNTSYISNRRKRLEQCSNHIFPLHLSQKKKMRLHHLSYAPK